MRKFTGLLVFFACVFGWQTVKAQQDPQFTQYLDHALYYNPAVAGMEGVTRLTAGHRTMWAGYGNGNPITQIVSFNTPVYRLSSGFGLNFVSDQLGPESRMQLQASYAYHLYVEELKTKLSFGVSAGGFAMAYNSSLYQPINDNDPLLVFGKEYQVRPDLGAGIHVRSEKIFGGVAFSHLLKSEFDFGNDPTRQALATHMNVMFGYDYDYGRKITITPSTLVHTDFNTYNVTLAVTGNYDEKYWGGVSVRQGESVNILTGYSVLKDKSLRFGYSFDYVIKGQEAKTATSHEVLVTYRLPQPSPSGKKIIRNPRFRHE